MASLIPCPHCGRRPKEEFTIRGAVTLRPAPDDSFPVWLDYLYQRDNPRGPLDEFWHHTNGCRRWLVVTRDTASHQVYACRDAAQAGSEEGQ